MTVNLGTGARYQIAHILFTLDMNSLITMCTSMIAVNSGNVVLLKRPVSSIVPHAGTFVQAGMGFHLIAGISTPMGLYVTTLGM